MYRLNNFEDFYNEKRKLDSCMDLKKELPENMFTNQYDNFFFSEFDLWGSASFWEILQNLTKHYEDTHVLVAVLDPHPEKYFYAHFNHYNWVNIPITVNDDEYFDIITSDPLDSPADALMYNSIKVVWTSESNNWVMYGDRDVSLIVVGVIGENTYLSSNELFLRKSELLGLQDIVHPDLLKRVYSNFK